MRIFLPGSANEETLSFCKVTIENPRPLRTLACLTGEIKATISRHDADLHLRSPQGNRSFNRTPAVAGRRRRLVDLSQPSRDSLHLLREEMLVRRSACHRAVSPGRRRGRLL